MMPSLFSIKLSLGLAYQTSYLLQASKLVDKVVDVLSTQHGAWSRHRGSDVDDEDAQMDSSVMRRLFRVGLGNNSNAKLKTKFQSI